MGRTTITKKEYNELVETAARRARAKAREKLDQKHVIVDEKMYAGMAEYDYLVARAVEQGKSAILLDGRYLSIM
jgi:hypothetical protein